MRFHDLIWLIPLFPLAGAAFNGLVTNRLGWSKKTANVVALLGSGLAWLWGWAAIAQWAFTEGIEHVHVVSLYDWIVGGTMTIADGSVAELVFTASFQLDPVSAVMVGFVTFVGFLIHLYSVGYMHDESDRAYSRYFSYLNLFMFSMLVLVLGSNLTVLFVGWEGVGLCSYLLIGFYFEKDWCADAGKKAFIVNRIGDFGFLLAIFFAFWAFGSVEFQEMFAKAVATPMAYTGPATVICLLLFVGAIGKSAQIPLYVWLPDAMAGPTPVSALIHAATMVTAGVYMVVRCNPLFQLSPVALLVVGIVGGLTAVFAATIGLAQNDIKKVLAYSTVSQLGYMFLGAGAGAFIAALFHVLTHAFFKACLFLGSGSVIHACGGNQDMRSMGGLKKYMPTTYWTFLMATIAIAGIVPWAGFFSKDEILAKAFAAGYTDLGGFGSAYYILWILGVLGAFLTAFYMFRLVYMTFHGEFRGGEEAERHLHESPWTMTLPLQILGVLSVVAGFLAFPGHLFLHPEWNLFERFMHPAVPHVELMEHPPQAEELLHGAADEPVAHGEVGEAIEEVQEGHGAQEHVAASGAGEADAHGGHGDHGAHAALLKWERALVFLSLAVAFAGILLATRLYLWAAAEEIPRKLAERFALAYRLILNKYYVDEIYDATVISGTVKMARGLWEFDARVVDGLVNGARHVTVGGSFLSGLFDLRVVDGLVNLVAYIWQVLSVRFRRLQVGYAQWYAMVMVLGAAALIVVYLWF